MALDLKPYQKFNEIREDVCDNLSCGVEIEDMCYIIESK